MIKEKQSEYGRMESMGFGVGKFKAWVKSKNPLKLLGFGTAIVAAGFGIISLIVHHADKSKSETRVKENAKKTDDAIRETQAKYDAEAKLYDAKVDADIRKAEALSKLRTGNTCNNASTKESLSEKCNRDKEIKSFVNRTLGLDNVETLQGERVCSSDRATRKERLPLVGTLLSRGDLCLLVSNPGIGKSALAYDMANSIAEGRESKLFHTPEGHQPPQVVYYMDAEMNLDDMGERYPQGLSFNFIRIPIHTPRPDVYYLLKDIVEIVGVKDITSDKTIVIDNIAAVAFGMNAKTLLVGLKSIQGMFEKQGFRLTVIVVVHTTKEAKDRPELEDVAGSADLTRLTTKVLFLNPTEHEGVVRINDGKHRATRKNKDLIVVRQGGVGFDENLHFEAVENVMSEEEVQKLMDELDGNVPKKPGAPQKLSEEDAEVIAERLDAGEQPQDLADEYHVSPNTIKGRAKPYRKKKR